MPRLNKLFGIEHVNVQPYSGSPANLAVYLAFCSRATPSWASASPPAGTSRTATRCRSPGKYFKSVPYGVRREDHRIDMDRGARRSRRSTSRS